MRPRYAMVLGAAAGGAVVLVACGLESGGAFAPDASVGPTDGGIFDVPIIRPIDARGGNDAPPPPADGGPPPPGDGAAPADAPAPPEAGPSDAAPPPGDAGCVYCNGQCVSTCNGCSAGQALCAATQTCGTCKGCVDGTGIARPIQCFECPLPSRQNPVGTCEPDDPNAYCLQGMTDNGFGHCECADAACPGSTEVCVDLNVGINVCVTCGEAIGLGRSTDNDSCQGGGKCHANDTPPDCK